MYNTIAIILGAVVLAILIGLHGKYNKNRETSFPVAELEKFNDK